MNYRQIEDAKRDELENKTQAALSENAASAFDECCNTASNGRLITTSNYMTDEYDDPISVCSCHCLGGSRCINHENFAIDNINPTDMITFNAAHLKRASV